MPLFHPRSKPYIKGPLTSSNITWSLLSRRKPNADFAVFAVVCFPHQHETVISTEAAHSFIVSGAAEKSAFLPPVVVSAVVVAVAVLLLLLLGRGGLQRVLKKATDLK